MTEFRSHLLGNFLEVSLGLTRKIWAADQVYKLIKAKVQALQDYHKALDRINQKASQTLWFEETGMTQIWSAMMKLDSDTIKSQETFLRNVNDNVLTKIADMKSAIEQTRKKLTNDGQQLTKQYHDMIAATNKARDSYYRVSQDLEGQDYAHRELVSASSSAADVNKEALGKIERKIARLREDAGAAEAAYRDQVGALGALQDAYYKDAMPRIMDEFQQAYASRLDVMHEALKAYVSETEAAHKAVLPATEDLVEKVAQLSTQAEIEEFVTKTQTFFTVPAPPAFEAYVRAPEGVPPPGYAAPAEKSLWSRLHKKSDTRRNIYISAPQPAQLQSAGSSGSASSATTNGGGNKNSGSGGESGGLFGVSIERLLDQQKTTMPQLRVPAIVVFLADTIIQLGGQSTQGVFRSSGSLASIEKEKARINEGEFVIPTDILDSTAIFKMFFSPSVVSESSDPIQVFNQNADPAKTVAGFLVRFIQDYFLKPEVESVTKMDANCLAPTLLPCFLPAQTQDFFELCKVAEREKQWMYTVLTTLDTSAYPSLDECTKIMNTVKGRPLSLPPLRPYAGPTKDAPATVTVPAARKALPTVPPQQQQQQQQQKPRPKPLPTPAQQNTKKGPPKLAPV